METWNKKHNIAQRTGVWMCHEYVSSSCLLIKLLIVPFLFTGLWQGMEDFQSWGTWIYQAVCKWQLKDFWTWFLFVLLWITQSFSTVIISMRVHTLTQPVDVKICSAKTVFVVVLVSESCTSLIKHALLWCECIC